MVSIFPANHTDKYLNLSNEEFATFWSALDMKSEWCGECYPHILSQRLKALQPQILQRAKESDGCWTTFGIEHSKISSYVRKLGKICDIAASEETKVLWS